MAVLSEIETLRHNLQALPEVLSLGELEVEDRIIKYISIETRSIGGMTTHQLDVADAPRLFEFYTEGLSEKSRRLFAPYPLFHTPPSSADEMVSRITNWKSENDWTVLVLVKDGGIIGLGLLKRYSTEQVTSGIAVRDEFLNRKIGYLLQTMIVEQARLLDLKKFHVKIVSDNFASVKLHEKCGFRITRTLPQPIYEEVLEYLRESDIKNGNQSVERQIIEMVIDFSY